MAPSPKPTQAKKRTNLDSQIATLRAMERESELRMLNNKYTAKQKPKQKRMNLRSEIADLRAMRGGVSSSSPDPLPNQRHVPINPTDAKINDTKRTMQEAQQRMMAFWNRRFQLIESHNIMLCDSDVCRWEYSSDNDTVIVKFSAKPAEREADYNLIMRLMELDEDIVFIQETSIDRTKFNESLLEHDHQTHSNFKVFNKTDDGMVVEGEDMLTMRPSEYYKYLVRVKEQHAKAKEEGGLCSVQYL